MNSPGDVDPTDLLVQTRAALLDAIDALGAHRDAVIVIGAQAVYLRTGGSTSRSPRPRRTLTWHSIHEASPTTRSSRPP